MMSNSETLLIINRAIATMETLHAQLGEISRILAINKRIESDISWDTGDLGCDVNHAKLAHVGKIELNALIQLKKPRPRCNCL